MARKLNEENLHQSLNEITSLMCDNEEASTFRKLRMCSGFSGEVWWREMMQVVRLNTLYSSTSSWSENSKLWKRGS